MNEKAKTDLLISLQAHLAEVLGAREQTASSPGSVYIKAIPNWRGGLLRVALTLDDFDTLILNLHRQIQEAQNIPVDAPPAPVETVEVAPAREPGTKKKK